MEPNTSGNLVTITCAVILTVLIGWLIALGGIVYLISLTM